MNRRKKAPAERPAMEPPRAQPAEERRLAPEPHPPKPNKAFLAVAILLFVLWMVFLIVLAVVS